MHRVIIFDKNDTAQGYKFTKSLITDLPANYPQSQQQADHTIQNIVRNI